MKHYENLKTILLGMENDVNKFYEGNNAAGTRVRKQLQDLKKEVMAMRNHVQEVRNERKGK